MSCARRAALVLALLVIAPQVVPYAGKSISHNVWDVAFTEPSLGEWTFCRWAPKQNSWQCSHTVEETRSVGAGLRPARLRSKRTHACHPERKLTNPNPRSNCLFAAGHFPCRTPTAPDFDECTFESFRILRGS
jgi:hypothetical protein